MRRVLAIKGRQVNANMREEMKDAFRKHASNCAFTHLESTSFSSKLTGSLWSSNCTIGKDFIDTHLALKDMLEHPGGAFDWSHDHNSHFETNKFALIDFSMNRKHTRPDMNIQGTIGVGAPRQEVR